MIWYIFYNKAQRAEAAGDVLKASDNFKKMMKLKPKVSAKIAYAYHLLRNGMADEAEALFNPHILLDSAVRGKKGDGSTQVGILAHTTYALVKWQKGDIDGAISYTENLMKRFKTTTLYSNLGYFYLTKGDFEKALEINLAAYEFAPDDSGICDNLGASYLKLGKVDEALALYEKMFAKKIPPSFPEAYHNYSLVLEQKCDYEKALEMAQKALSLNYTKLISLTRDEVSQTCERLLRR